MINKKAIIFSHNDLDGAGCVILGMLQFETCKYRINNYNNIDDKVKDFVKQDEDKKVKSMDYLFITDISITDETIDFLNKSIYKDSYYIIDHHDTRKEIHNGNNIFIITHDEDNKPNSGTNLFMEFLEHKFSVEFNIMTKSFVDMVRCWDTWLWKEYDMLIPLQLNILCMNVNYIEFVKSMLPKLQEGNSFSFFTESEQKKVDSIIETMNRYYESMKAYKFKNENGYTVAYCSAEDYTSYIADLYLDNNKDVDYLVIANLKRGLISMRTQRNDIHVGEIAQRFGGGGHPKASGLSIPEDFMETIFCTMNQLFK